MDNRPSPINGLVSNHLHHLVVTPMPIAVVVRRVGIQVTVAVAVNVAVGRTAAVGGPFCAIAREPPPASNTVATMTLFRMLMLLLLRDAALTRPPRGTRWNLGRSADRGGPAGLLP
jgi:hypothetical protein